MGADPVGSTAQLDRVIDQLVVRSRDPEHAAERLRTLTLAIYAVNENLSLDTVLRSIVEAARELCGARYGALGVIGADGHDLAQFIHVGVDDDTAAAIGPLPEGKGLLGALITDPHPLRLDEIATDRRSSGFPAHHPEMKSFLGVPVTVGGQVFGNLYLSESAQGSFTAEDEELVSALAVAAGTAIGNARLYREARVQQQWLSASVDIGAQLLSESGEDPLRTIARSALEIADADTVSLGLVADDDATLLVEISYGAGAEELVGKRFPLSSVVGGLAVDLRQPLRFLSSDLPDHRTSTLATVVDAGPLLVLPLYGDTDVRGVLTLVRRRGRQAFTDSELAMAAAFASHASLALELADARAAQQKVVLLEDRDRIARDLHDHVIQELFSIGISLQGVAMTLGVETPMAERIQHRVDDIDRTIRRIRTSIFALRGPLDAQTGGLRERVLALATDMTPMLGFTPHVSFTGLVDIVVGPSLADDVEAVVREALTNVARHAHATTVDVDLSVTVQDIVLTVSDDGVGMEGSQRRSGIYNLRKRAEEHRGSLSTTTNGSGGTTLTWKALV